MLNSILPRFRVAWLVILAAACASAPTPTGDAAPDGMAMGGTCGTQTCASGQYCIPGCRGVCFCDPMPDSGSCPNGRCLCGAMSTGCEPAPPAPHCESSLPPGCSIQGGQITCLC